MAGETNTTPGAAPASQNAAPSSTPAPTGGTQNTDPGTTAIGGGAADPNATAIGGGQPQGDAAKGGQGEPATAKPVELKLPEGVTIADDLLKEYRTLAEKFDPQKGLEFVIKSRDAALTDMQKQVSEQVAKQRNEWLTQARTDKEIGGSAWDTTVADASKAVGYLGGDALRDVLNKTGLGNHPEIIRAFARVGKSISEDSIAGRAGAAPTPDNSTLTPEERFAKTAYPTMQPQNKEK